MMDEIALHIQDIVMNAVAAGATCVRVAVDENTRRDRLEVRVGDDGKGMDAQRLSEVLEHFASEKKERRRPIALGLALLRQTAEACGGEMRVTSAAGRGTQVEAWMQFGHLDRPPLGNLRDTIFTLSVGAPDVNIVFSHHKDGAVTHFESAQIRRALGAEISIQSPAGMRAIKQALSAVRESGVQESEA